MCLPIFLDYERFREARVFIFFLFIFTHISLENRSMMHFSPWVFCQLSHSRQFAFYFVRKHCALIINLYSALRVHVWQNWVQKWWHFIACRRFCYHFNCASGRVKVSLSLCVCRPRSMGSRDFIIYTVQTAATIALQCRVSVSTNCQAQLFIFSTINFKNNGFAIESNMKSN